MTLKINDEAPNFNAETTQGKIDFHDWAGKSWVVLFSHPKNFTPVCTTELGVLEGIKNEFDKVEAAFDFVAELLFSAKYVRIILGKATDPSHTIEFSRLLPAINGAKFGETHRKVSIGVGLTVEDFDVHRAVHWPEQVAIDFAAIKHLGKFSA